MRRLENDPSKFCKSALLAHKPRDIHMHETVRKHTMGDVFNQRSMSVARFSNRGGANDNDYLDRERIPEVFT